MTVNTSPVDVDREFLRIVNELSRRGLLGGGLSTAAVLGLAACGGNRSDGASGGSKTRIVNTAKGDVTVPADPRRVAAIQPSATATLYDLGMTPVGTYDQGASYISPRYADHWKSAPKIGTGGQIDVEKVAALDPDLIIGADFPWNTDVYAHLHEIAPTVIAPTTTWQATTRCTADAVNRLAGLGKLQQRLHSRSVQIKTDYAEILRRFRWDILQGGFDPANFWVYGAKSDVGTILAGAGVRFATASTRTPGSSNRALSYERLEELGDADVIGYYANYDGTPNNRGPQLFAQKLWKDLNAVRSDRLVPIPDFLPGGYGDALAIVDELEAGLKKFQADIQ